MSDINDNNLIDLSLDDIVLSNNTQSKTELHAQLLKNSPEFVPPSWRKSDNLENNPFDSVQKLADRLTDPFNVAESEAYLKAQHVLEVPSEIKLGNLLSLSEDKLLNDMEKMPTAHQNAESGIANLQEIDLESPPVALNEKHSTDSVSEADTTPNSSAETSAKLKKNMEHRKRLLKLSISNSAFSSPAIRKDFNESDNILGTPLSSIFCKTVEFEENLISSESPLKFIEDEHNSSGEPQYLIDSEKKFEADLEMLKIPILNELPSPAFEPSPNQSDENAVNINAPILENTQLDLEGIKTKLKAKKSEINDSNRHKISNLIENLKSLISSGEMVNERKEQARNLLESLTSALIPSNLEEPIQNSEKLDAPPQTITRQDTFDLDILERHETNTEIPKCMFSSSATYDGETSIERKDFNLPEIDPVSPPSVTSPNHEPNNIQSDVNNIVEQLSRLLINNSADNQTNSNNPTLIVVMNTNQLNSLNNDDYKQSVENAKARCAFVANYLENSTDDNSTDLTKLNSLPRRRSQSLSIHDKIKVVHLPLQTTILHPVQKQHSMQIDEIPPTEMTPPSSDKEIPEFKTPARLRRYSYSSGTPYTAQVGLRKTGFRALNSSTDMKKNPQMRKTQTLDTHHEDKQHAAVRPLSNNLTTFKPDLKKKVKPKIESILKSSRPLKATIPVKKVAPMLQVYPPSPEKKVKTKASGTPTTPIPTRVSKLGFGVGYPNACSTPSAFTSPLKGTSAAVTKPRYSYVSTTPNPKSTLTNSSTCGLKRRTIAELRVKSPLKPRVNNSGLQMPSSSRVSSGTSRLSISAGARTSKTTIKAVANTAAVKPSTRLGTRLSVGGSVLSDRNKENKRF